MTRYVAFGSFADLQRPLEYRRFSARNETFGTERRQCGSFRPFKRTELSAYIVPEAAVPGSVRQVGLARRVDHDRGLLGVWRSKSSVRQHQPVQNDVQKECGMT
jgi:hypothetical protein